MANMVPTVIVVNDNPSLRFLFELSAKESEIELRLFDTEDNSMDYLEDNKPGIIIP
jgi:hypothetical protein